MQHVKTIDIELAKKYLFYKIQVLYQKFVLQ